MRVWISWAAACLLKNWVSLAIVGAALGVLFFKTGNYWSATWLSKWAFLIALSAGAMSFWAAKRTSFFHLPLMLYVFASLFTISVWVQSPYQTQVDAVTLLALQKNALFGLVEWAMAMSCFAWVSKKNLIGVGCAMTVIWMIGTLGYLSNPHLPDNGMWFGNPSMGASLLACLLPFVLCLRTRNFGLWEITTWLMTFLMVYKTRASIPWGVLGVTTAAYLMTRTSPKYRFYAFLTTILLAISMCSLGKLVLGAQFWDENQRFEIWKMGWQWLWDHGHPSVGMGYSTSQIFLPIEQLVTGHYHDTYFLWFHSDWLQLAIEGGWIGMTCVFLSVGRLLWASWKRPPFFAALAGFITMGLFNYPLRMPIHCFCLVLICGSIEALSGSRSAESSFETRAES